MEMNCKTAIGRKFNLRSYVGSGNVQKCQYYMHGIMNESFIWPNDKYVFR